MRERRPRGRALNALLVLTSMTLALGIIEIALRVSGYSLPVFARADAELGWTLRPNLAGLSVHEGAAVMQTNGQGFRAKHDWKVAKPDGTYRIAILGDSFVESSNVAYDDGLPERIGAALSACPALAGRTIETMNFGVSGYGTAQEVLLLRSKALPYSPDLVVLAVYLGNDVANNARSLTRDFAETRPYFVIHDDELRLDDSFLRSDAFAARQRQSILADVVNRSRVLQILKQVQAQKPIRRRADTRLDTRYVAARDQPPAPEYPEIYKEPVDPRWRNAWDVTGRLIARARDLSLGAGADFAAVIVPQAIEVFPDSARRKTAASTLGVPGLNGAERRLSAIAASHGMAIFSPLDRLRDYSESHAMHLYGFPPLLGDGHLNALGNAVAGKAIAAYLCGRAGPR